MVEILILICLLFSHCNIFTGKCCTHAVVYAKLFTPDGVDNGLHAFVVPIRDPSTLEAYAGVLVGDLGEKVGLNGVDNGFVVFNHYRIPREYLLNRTGDVTPEGKYVTPFSDPNKRLGIKFEFLILNTFRVILLMLILLMLNFSHIQELLLELYQEAE